MERSGIVFHFFLILSRLELAAGFGPIGPLPGPLWVESWFRGQQLLALYPLNPQPQTDCHQHCSTFRMKLVVTSDFIDLGPIYMHNQSD